MNVEFLINKNIIAIISVIIIISMSIIVDIYMSKNKLTTVKFTVAFQALGLLLLFILTYGRNLNG